MPDYAPVETRDTNLPLGVPSLFCLEAAPIRDVSRTSDTTWQVQSNDQWLPPGEETLKEMR